MTTDTVQTIDSWILLVTSIWFIPKGLLFLATAILSWYLTPKVARTALGDAYRAMFGGLFVFSVLMGLLFFVRWNAGPPSEVTTAIWVAMSLRLMLLLVMAYVTGCEIWAARELIKRVRARRFPDLDHIRPQPDGLP
jgi:hypothetical protein